MQGIYLTIWSKPAYETFTRVSIPQAGVSHSHQIVPHKSDHRYASTPDFSGLRGLPSRTPLWSDQALPKCPTSPSDTLKCAAPAHLRTTTDLQYNFPQSLFGMDFTFSTRSTSNTSKYQSQINSGYIIWQVWITHFIGSNFQTRPSLSRTYSRLAALCHL